MLSPDCHCMLRKAILIISDAKFSIITDSKNSVLTDFMADVFCLKAFSTTRIFELALVSFSCSSVMSFCNFCLDHALTLPWPYLDLALTLPSSPFLDLILTLPWPHLIFLWPGLNLTLTLPWPCLDISFTLPLKFSPNRISNSWDIPDMYKCHQNKCCLDKCHRDSWNLF